jgi:dienelactone hydrolase
MSAPHADCCPPGSWPALSTDGKCAGKVEKLDGVDVYITGNPASAKSGWVLIPDIFSIVSGRSKQVADQIALAGYYVVFPVIDPERGVF